MDPAAGQQELYSFYCRSHTREKSSARRSAISLLIFFVSMPITFRGFQETHCDYRGIFLRIQLIKVSLTVCTFRIANSISRINESQTTKPDNVILQRPILINIYRYKVIHNFHDTNQPARVINLVSINTNQYWKRACGWIVIKCRRVWNYHLQKYCLWFEQS